MRINARLTDAAVLEELGQRLRQTRLNRNLTQARLAEEAGVSAPTINQLEHGKPVQLITLVRALRVLDLLDGLEAAIPEPLPSPIDQLRRRGQERRRASSGRVAGPRRQPELFAWGDQREDTQ
jgi:transcriptional regulator with XRE-family HTH domain